MTVAQWIKRVFMLVWCLNLLPMYMWAQQLPKDWYIKADAGIVSGSTEMSGEARLQAGWQKGPLLLGLGSGLDGYRFQSVPVLALGQYHFGKRKHKPFLTAAGGLNIACPTESQKWRNSDWWFGDWRRIWPEPATADYQNGWMAEAGAGYALYGKRGHGLSVAIVYSVKTNRESFDNIAYGGNGEQTSYTERLRYTLNRMILRLSYKW